jgi:hypothetical protein
MGDLLWMVRWAGFHLGYAVRWTLILAMRESPLSRFADDEVDRLLTKATSNGWIRELKRTAPYGPGYVLTRKGERALAQHKRRKAASRAM